MEAETSNDPPELIMPQLGREIYITPEQLAVAALVDGMDERIFKPWEAANE